MKLQSTIWPGLVLVIIPNYKNRKLTKFKEVKSSSQGHMNYSPTKNTIKKKEKKKVALILNFVTH